VEDNGDEDEEMAADDIEAQILPVVNVAKLQ